MRVWLLVVLAIFLGSVTATLEPMHGSTAMAAPHDGIRALGLSTKWIYPSANDPAVQSVVSKTAYGSNAYIVSYEVKQFLVIPFAGSSAHGTGTANFTDPAPSAALPYANQTWINQSKAACTEIPLSSGSSARCPVGTVTCAPSSHPLSATLPAVYYFNRACPSVVYAGGPTFCPSPCYAYLNITRIVAYLVVQTTRWAPVGLSTHSESTSLYVTVGNVSAHNGVPAPTYSTLMLRWAVPYPTGQWYPYATTVLARNNTTSVSPFAQYYNAIVLEQQAPPIGLYNFTFAVNGIPFTGNHTGNVLSFDLSNLILTLDNDSTLSNGYHTETGTWTNNYPQPFTGNVSIEGPWVSLASNITIQINSEPVQSQWTSGAILIPAGTLNVTNGSAISILVVYLPGSLFSFKAPVGILNGLSITISFLTFLVGLSVGIVMAFVHVTSLGRRNLLLYGVATLMLFGLIGVWFYA
jgi:hypothetical protein